MIREPCMFHERFACPPIELFSFCYHERLIVNQFLCNLNLLFESYLLRHESLYLDSNGESRIVSCEL